MVFCSHIYKYLTVDMLCKNWELRTKEYPQISSPGFFKIKYPFYFLTIGLLLMKTTCELCTQTVLSEKLTQYDHCQQTEPATDIRNQPQGYTKLKQHIRQYYCLPVVNLLKHSWVCLLYFWSSNYHLFQICAQSSGLTTILSNTAIITEIRR